MEEAMTNHESTNELRKLWQNQPVAPFQMSPDELRLRMQQQYKQYRTWRYPLVPVVTLIACSFLGIVLFHSEDTFVRVGFCLLILGCAYAFLKERRYAMDRKRSFAKAESLGNTGSLKFYRSELQLQLNQYRGTWWASAAGLPAFVLILVGWWHATPARLLDKGHLILLCVFIAAYLVLIALNALDVSREARRCRRKIDALDAIERDPE